MRLPEVFHDFCIKNGINIEIYDQDQRQYFYTQAKIEKDAVGVVGKAIPCEKIPNFYQITSDSSFQFSTSNLYEEGHLLPMDLSSGLAVALLNLSPSDHILDLCCAPGGKLILSAFLQQQARQNGFSDSPETIGTITGVDLSENRLSTCRSMIKKYKVECARLFCADGTLFNEPVSQFIKPPKSESEDLINSKKLKLKLKLKSNAFHETTAFRRRPTRSISGEYNKVLVDAQCTHDGSIKHIRKHQQNNWSGFDLTQFDDINLAKLHALQLRLLENGFKLLKPDGILVYSTCSLSRGQNEEIIAKFLLKWRDFGAISLPFEGSNELGQLRMCPPDFDSGFFVCRLGKIKRD